MLFHQPVKENMSTDPEYKLTLPPNYTKPLLPGLKKWVEALRSGKYTQGRRNLHLRSLYCCLGVLCEIQGRPISDQRGVVAYDGSIAALTSANPLWLVLHQTGHLPPGVAVIPLAAFFERTTPLAPPYGSHSYITLATLNDLGFTFNQIADILEAVWEEPTEVSCGRNGRAPRRSRQPQGAARMRKNTGKR